MHNGKVYATMTDVERKKLLHRVRSILAKQGANGTTLEEGLFAGEMARKLMDQYELSMDIVEETGQEAIYTHYIDMDRQTNSHPITDCMVALADYCDIHCWWEKRWSEKRQTRTVHRAFFGRKADVDIGVYFYEVIRRGMDEELDKFGWSKKYRYVSKPLQKKSAHSFAQGLAGRISARLRAMKNARDVSLRNSPDAYALLLLKRGQLVREYKNCFVEYGPSISPVLQNDAAFFQGYEAGMNVQLCLGLEKKNTFPCLYS